MPVPKLVDGVTIYVMTEEEKKQDIIRKMKKEEEATNSNSDKSDIKGQLNRIEAKLDELLARGGN